MIIPEDLTSKQEFIRNADGFDRTLGVRYVKLEPDEVVAVLDVTPVLHQPFGRMHGGVHLALAESTASVGAWMACPPGQVPVGLEVNANHLRAVRGGRLTARAIPIHTGRTTHVWEVKISDDEHRLTCIARCTVAILDV